MHGSSFRTCFSYYRVMFRSLPLCVRRIDIFRALLIYIIGFCGLSQPLNAQVVTNYADTPAAAIAIPDNGCAAGATSVVRTINVPTTYLVSDVNIGVLATHIYRGDLRIILTHGATSVILFNRTGAGADNLNVTFDDEGAGGLIGSHNTTDPLAPIYNSTKIPAAALSAFDGQNASGAWTLNICDGAPADTGSYLRSTLTITSAPPTFADLSLTKTVSNASPAVGGTTDYTLTVSNSATSNSAAAGVTVRDVLPAGTTFNSVVSGTGTYNSSTGIWTVGAVPIGATRSIVIRVNVTASAGSNILNTAEITASSVADLDATPNNGATSEDDYASQSFTVAGTAVAGTPPNLVCPIGSSIFDWDAVAWTTGSTTGTFALTNIGNITYTLTNPGVWLNNATYGGQAPVRQNVLNGGFTGQNALWMGSDLANQNQSVTAVIALQTAVPGVQFRMLDIDFGPSQFADRATVTGTFNGAPVIPVLTNGIANYVVGNTAFGNAPAVETDPNGNVVVTFQSPVDTITIRYGNHAAAPTNPGQQWIALHDLIFCNPQANVSVTKISSVLSDGVSASNFKSVPGAVVRYCIIVSNAGSGTATNVAAIDALPSGVTFVAGSMRSGTSCATAANVEDDNSTGIDETDPIGASFAANSISINTQSLGVSNTVSLTFNVTVN
jgi:uncharacterized repeat protein (TIGR01451 family)